MVPAGGGFSHYQYDIQLEVRLVGIFHSPVQHVIFSWLVVLWFFLRQSLQLKIFVGKCHLSKSSIMDILRPERESACVTLDQTIASQPRVSFSSGRSWLVHALLDPEQGFESDFHPSPPSPIQVFAITAAVWIDNA